MTEEKWQRKTSSKITVDALSEKQARAEHARLHAEISEHDRHYYQDADAPTVTDAEDDALRKRYGAIEQRFPGSANAGKPDAEKVGIAPTGRFEKVRHVVPMLSLDNAFAGEDVSGSSLASAASSASPRTRTLA